MCGLKMLQMVRCAAVICVLAVVAASCGDDGDDAGSPTTTAAVETTDAGEDGADSGATTEATTTTAPDVGTGADAGDGWSLAASHDGVELRWPMAWEDGFAALSTTWADDGPESELWLSADGVDWAPAPDQPPGLLSGLLPVVYSAGDDLFVLVDGDGTAPGTLWRHDDGTWQEVFSDPRLDGAAIGPERIVAFHDGGSPPDSFEILGVIDVDTLAVTEPAELPTPDLPGVPYEGRVMALDDGFIARQSWIVSLGPDEVDHRYLRSADGIEWTRADDLDGEEETSGLSVWETSLWPGPVSHDGRDLVRTRPSRAASLAWTDDGRAFTAVEPVMDNPTTKPSATEVGFFAASEDDGLTLHHSPDARTWRRIEAPPVWADRQGALPDDRSLIDGRILVSDDDLLAVAVTGAPGAGDVWFPEVEDVATEIWRAPIDVVLP